MRQRILLALATCALVLLPAAAAHASSRQFTTVEAPNELLNGAPDAALDDVVSLGATAIRIQMTWRAVAPAPDSRSAPSFNASDPNAYPAGGWLVYDRAIDAARARGLKVLLTLTGPAPAWATKRGDGLTSPSASAFGTFATAVGRRYGSRISWWSVWNEPNLGKLLKPIKGLASATVYRNLYRTAYSGLRTAGVRAPVLLGELAPIGNSLRDIGTISPLRFLRATLCLDSRYRHTKRRCGRLSTSGFAMHPYTTAAGPRFTPPNRDDVSIGTIGRLVGALDRAARAGALPRRLPVYITEFGVQSYPDRILGVPLDVQSDDRSLAEYMAWRTSRVRSFSQYLLQDDVTVAGAHGRFESGLYLFAGRKPKPALASFRLPLVVIPGHGARATLWGFVRPAHGHGGSVTVEQRDGSRGRWRKVGTQRYGGSGYWKRGVGYRRGRAFRVRWTSPGGTAYVGPPTVAR